MKKIRSKSNQDFKDLIKLKRRKYREREGAFLVEGPVVISEALASGHLPRALYFSEARANPDLMAQAQEAGISLALVEEGLFSDLVATETDQGVLGVFESPVGDLGSQDIRGRWLYTDGIQDPANLGGMVRSLEAFGFDGLLLGPGTVDVLNPKVVRGTMASIFRTRLLRAPDQDFFNLAKDLPVYVLDLEGGLAPEDLRPHKDLVLVVGNEASGPRREVIDLATGLISIPMAPGIDSLNANVAASIAMYILGGE